MVSLPYVFVIGFNKTGTTAIHRLFEANGFPSIHWDKGNLARRMLENCISGRPVLAGYDQRYKVFSDLLFRTNKFWFEGNSLFRTIDADYLDLFYL